MSERRYVTQFAHNEQVRQTFMASEKQLRPNRNGNLYLQLELSDRSGAIGTRMWNANESDFKGFDNGDYVVAEGTTQLFQGNMQMIIKSIRKARPDEVIEADFLVLQDAEVEKMAARLAEVLRGINTPELKNLCECYLMDDQFMGKFTRAPAGMKNHHAYTGGLLDHVLSLCELVLLIAPRYPQLDGDKLLVGAFLHDAAKTEELAYDRDISYTDEGQMLGHMVIGITMLDDKIREAERLSGEPFPKALGMELKHMIISHHGEYAYGSSKLPMTLEAIALHQLDNLDAKLASSSQLINDCLNGESHWTQYFPNIDRKLWKGEREG
ncbi:3'-5' exoribonuclease YhaM [Pirellulimonas nuda]|uniref:3'-5' exoribonuclease YhaM n=1 Tax=Pirellulimonas nuda TaxID=2528009 RepID=A0A518D7Q1_9BACT|nr:HD domain-containing protein [Pirellulimonas nuda]QDU87489.1 3'-5' exoribonuclease YhaM [Pirellulimonas nuda]